jgi:uncharacterized protein
VSRPDPTITRRDFLAGAAGLAALGVTRGAAAADKGLPRRKLGKTGLEVSVVGYGAEFIADQALAEYLVEQGVTHIDTAPTYQEGNSERLLAPILAKHKNVTIATKFHRGIPVDAPKEQYLQSFEQSCERMQVKGVDLLYLHDRRTPDSIDCPGAKQAFDELKAAGRVKHFAMSTHLSQDACIAKGLELGWFDVMLCAHSFLYPQTVTDALKAAADKGIGIMVIKVCKALSGGADWYPRATDEQKAVLGQANLFQASIKWTLKHDFISGAVLCISNYEEADQDLAAAREALTAREGKALDTFRLLAAREDCRGCGSCDAACPRGVAVSDILRYAVYSEGYRQRRWAAHAYRALPPAERFAACDRCGACDRACPYGLAVTMKLERAHQLLA